MTADADGPGDSAGLGPQSTGAFAAAKSATPAMVGTCVGSPRVEGIASLLRARQRRDLHAGQQLCLELVGRHDGRGGDCLVAVGCHQIRGDILRRWGFGQGAGDCVGEGTAPPWRTCKRKPRTRRPSSPMTGSHRYSKDVSREQDALRGRRTSAGSHPSLRGLALRSGAPSAPSSHRSSCATATACSKSDTEPM